MGALSFLSSELSMRQGGPGNAWPSQEDAPGHKPLAITLGRALTSAISEPRRICVSQLRKRGRKRHPATEAAQKQTRAVGSQTSVLCPTARCPRAGGRGRRDTAHGTEEGWEAAAAEAGGTRAADRRGEAGRGSEHQATPATGGSRGVTCPARVARVVLAGTRPPPPSGPQQLPFQFAALPGVGYPQGRRAPSLPRQREPPSPDTCPAQPRPAPPRPGEGWRLQALGPEGRRGQELKRRVRGKGQEEKWTRGPLTSPLATERFLPPPALLRQRPRPRIPSWRVGLSDAAGVSASSRNPGACFKVSGTERAGTELSLSCPARPDREGGSSSPLINGVSWRGSVEPLPRWKPLVPAGSHLERVYAQVCRPSRSLAAEAPLRQNSSDLFCRGHPFNPGSMYREYTLGKMSLVFTVAETKMIPAWLCLFHAEKS
ncbi:uncharacterized protein LOC111091121 [Canis lupus familiaris]|uniref:uncharacterized protein LOC111091121 n=1 Tax=Canis lupus familiaris TaxID=9615 RepID=UPI000BAA22F1|nr:uncharacterized protein LOC111091121 [Canis lupus familiaris]|eukprot:XP_022261692.1 uncharacterized protein LOC111091121 [Canis lupus familiaris]